MTTVSGTGFPRLSRGRPALDLRNGEWIPLFNTNVATRFRRCNA